MTESSSIPLDHVALVVGNLEAALEALRRLDLPAGPIEDFPAEGTREVYLGAGQQAALLLMQPTDSAGPYARALDRRGPGLHHLAINVLSLDETIARLAGSGWYLHLRSLETIERGRTAWLARPGVGVLIEVHESRTRREASPLVTEIEVPVADAAKPLFEALGLVCVRASEDPFAWISLAGARLRADLREPV